MQIPLGTYRHYKGGIYEVVGEARHSETHEELVVYVAQTSSAEFPAGTTWVRPKKMFSEEVDFEGERVARFSRVGEGT